MAKAKIICGACGGELSLKELKCPRCGAPVEHDRSDFSLAQVPSSEELNLSVHQGPPRCEVCGHVNAKYGAYCESCGVKLPRIVKGPEPLIKKPAAELSEATPVKQQKPERGKRPQRPRKKRFEPWQLIAGIALLVVGGYLAFIQLGGASKVTQVPMQGTMPLQPTVSAQELDRLQNLADTNPGDAAAQLHLANALHDNAMSDMRLFFKATETYKKYLAMKPDDPNARVDLGICYYQMARFDSLNSVRLFGLAISEMETAFKKDPKHQPAAFNLGIVHLSEGETEEAAKWFRKAVSLNPDSDLGQRARSLLQQHAFPTSSN